MLPNEFVSKYHKEFKRNYSNDDWITIEKDHEALIDLITKYNIKSIFEIGTWEGYTTLLMWRHPNVNRLKTLDIHKDMNLHYKHTLHFLRDKSFYGSFIKNTGVELVFCDSRKYEPNEQYDMVFIDGNHNYRHVKNDTELALKFNPKIIVWHDYPNEQGVRKYINKLKEKGQIINTYDKSIIVWKEI